MSNDTSGVLACLSNGKESQRDINVSITLAIERFPAFVTFSPRSQEPEKREARLRHGKAHAIRTVSIGSGVTEMSGMRAGMCPLHTTSRYLFRTNRGNAPRGRIAARLNARAIAIPRFGEGLVAHRDRAFFFFFFHSSHRQPAHGITRAIAT